MSCKSVAEQVDNSKVFKAIRRRVGTNDTLYFSYYAAVIDKEKGDDFSEDFKDFYKKRHPNTRGVSLNSSKANEVVNDIISFHNLNRPDGNETVINDNRSNIAAGYTNVADRKFCQRIVGSDILDIYRIVTYEQHQDGNKSRAWYVNAVRASFGKTITERLAQLLNIPANEVATKYNKERRLNAVKGYIALGESINDAKILGTYQEVVKLYEETLGEDITDQEKNYIATFREMINSTTEDITGRKVSDLFFDDVFRDKRLGHIKGLTNSEFGTDEEEEAQQAEEIATGEDVSMDDVDDVKEEFDLTFRAYNTHDGQYSTFMMHVGANIKTYLNSLRKLVDTGFIDGHRNYDTSNPMGVADTMNDTECAVMLYTSVNYYNVDSMIASIRRISESVAGFESFAQLADDLEKDYDFAYELYTTFGKAVMSKSRTTIDGDSVKSRIVNRMANKVDALRYQFESEANTSLINVDSDFARTEYNKLEQQLKTLTQLAPKGNRTPSRAYLAKQAEVLGELNKQLRRYHPSIDLSALVNYVETSKTKGEVDRIANIKTLLKDLNAIIFNSDETKSNYTSKLIESSKLRNEGNSTAEVWNESYVSTGSRNAISDLASHLGPHMVISVELNSTNVHGKKASDVINSSMITNLMDMLHSELNSTNDENTPINNYAKYKFRSNQYDLSNILVEKRDERGRIINYGLFTRNNDGYVPTRYATKLLQMSLFDGVNDLGQDKALLFSEMSKGDYIVTAMENYFKCEYRLSELEGASFAHYFMRTPSDAPKNFMFTAPKYKLGDNFWIIDNPQQLQNSVNALYAAIPRITSDNEYLSLSAEEVDNVNTIVRLLAGKTIPSLDITSKSNYVRPDKNDATAYLTIRHGDTTLLVKGTLAQNVTTKVTELTKVTLEGLYADNEIANDPAIIATKEYFRNELIKGNILLSDGTRVTRSINRNHPIYKQLYAAFEQEMIDAATAINSLFDNNGGAIILADDNSGNPIMKEGIDDRRVFKNYHHKNNEYIDTDGNEHKESGIIQNRWVETPEGWVKTNTKRLSGNVFTSDKFTVTDRTTGNTRNYLNEVLDDAVPTEEDGKIHILYGAATNTYLHINEDGSVTFTPAQKATIEEALDNFIKDYIAASVERINNFSNLLSKVPHDEDSIAEFVLNYRLAYFNANDLFEGNAKFYSSAQDFLKRAKEVQGSGVPYALRDITKPLFGEDRVAVEKSYLNSDEMQAIVSGLHDCKQYTTFRGVTIKNTVRSPKEAIDTLTKQLTDIFVKEGFTKTDAKAKATQMMAGYKRIKTNDAQSYITFEEWIRRISARGQLHKYKDLIERVLDESKPLSVNDVNQLIQVQKNFYYDMYYDEELGVMAPRQIKNAEFVLVPRLIRGTELEAIYNIMTHYGIDQLNTEETSKAGKANVLTLWDDNGNLTKAWTDDFNNNVRKAIQIYDYNYLYTQQETPNHLNAENKAGIQLMKKIMDNIPENSPLYEVKKRLMANYAYNIYDSFKSVIDELGVELDEHGNLKLDENETIKGLKLEQIYKRLEEEMMRLGLDSNMLDYCTLEDIIPEEETGTNGIGARPKMPPHFSNVKSKIENIAQSLFNNRITRQKLPGFHAAQVTNIGWKNTGQGKSYIYSKNLQYHPNGERYIEVMLPASNFGFDINDSKYDNYREKAIEKNWSAEKLEEEIKKDMLEELQAKKLDTVIGYRIPTEGKQSVCVMKVVGFTSDALGSTIVVPDGWVAQTGSDFDIDSIYGIQFATYRNADGIHKIKYSTDVEENYRRYVLGLLDKDVRKELYAKARIDRAEARAIASENPDESYIAYSDRLDDAAKDNIFFYCKQYAKDYNLMSFDDYAKMSFAAQNSRDARNNQILADMIEILQSDEALEENLSRSNFDDIIDARDAILKGSAIEKIKTGRSTYDFLDQADYQEDAMSGAKLKGASVARDNFCSVCNTVKPTLTNSVTIVYKADAKKIKQLKKAFDKVRDLGNGYVEITHDTFGWSKNNRNVEGKLITAYSSQTTAHILDAIKEGNIPNVNSFTFNVYKLFPDIGSDYRTAVAFMMQPGVTEIVNAYNKGNSVYVSEYQTPTDLAIREIAKKLGFAVDRRVTTKDLEKKIKAKYNVPDQVLDADKLIARIHRNSQESLPVEDIVFDYAVIKQYQKLSTIASKVGDYTRVCNPDKFGAKQSIFATRKVFRDIEAITRSQDKLFTVNKDGKEIDFLEAIYPDISKGISAYVSSENNDSVYPSLHHFLKYASATSVKINSSLFLTQSDGFISLVNNLTRAFSITAGRDLTEERYNDYERYILTTIYNHVPVISKPVAYDKTLGFVETDGDTATERQRIFGYGYQADTKVTLEDGRRIDFEPTDINNVTETEIEQFASLTPAQKVIWVQQHFRDSLICKHINARLFNARSANKNLVGSQTIEFIEDGQNMDYIYEEFRKTFQNENPLLAMTAMDIVKYGFVVEGFKMRKRSINRVIDNDILINDLGKLGTGIVGEVNSVMETIAATPSHEIQVGAETVDSDTITENYVRSHTEMPEIAHAYIRNAELKTVIAPHRNAQGVIAFEVNDDTIGFLETKNIGKNVTFEVTRETEFVANPYIILRTYNGETLYKIKVGDKTGTVYLYPISKLQANEVGNISVNPENNVGINYTKEFYEDVTDSYEDTASNLDIVAFTELAKSKLESNEDYKVNKQTKNAIQKEPKPLDINDDTSGGISQLKQQIINHFGTTNYATLYVESEVLTKHIFVPGVEYGLNDIYVNGRRYIAYKVDTRALYPYTKNINWTIPDKLKHLEPIIDKARQRGINSGHPGEAHVNDLFAIVPYTSSQRSSSITESIVDKTAKAARSITRTSNNTTDEAADKFKSQLHRKGIELHDAKNKSISDNLKETIINTAEYVTSKVDKLLNGENGLNFFTKIPGTEEYVSIYDPRTLELIADNPQLRRMFLRTLLEAQNVIDTFSAFAKTALTEDNADLKMYIEKIEKAVDTLESSGILEKAQTAYVTQYLDKVTNNPNVRRNLISVMDNFHQTGYLTSYISDLQDIANPIVQIITSDVMADIRSKEFAAKEQVKAYRNYIADLKDRAAKAGLHVDFNRIIDKYGKFINDYNEEFIDALDTLVTAKNEAYDRYKSASSPVEEYKAYEDYLRKQLEYRKFVLAHTHQQIKDEFVKQQLDADEDMLTHHKDVFVEYKMLTDKLYDVLSHTVRGKLDAHWEEERKKLNNQIQALRSNVIILPGGIYALKEDLMEEDLSPDLNKRRTQIINSRVSAEAIDKYIIAKAQLNETIYKFDDKFGFKEELDKRLQIIKSREIRNEFGKLVIPEATLLNDKEYVEAKEWLRENAIFRYSIWDVSADDKEKALKPNDILISLFDAPDAVSASFNLRVQAAINFFKNSVGERGNRKAAYKLLAKRADARDELGVIDGRKFTDEEIAVIRKEQEAKYNIGESSPYNEKGIIHNTPADDIIYSSAFYKGLNVGGVTNPEYLAIVKNVNGYLRRALDSSTGRLNTSELSVEEINAILDEFAKLGYDRTEQVFDGEGAIKKRKGVKRKDVKEVQDFIEKNVDFVTDDKAFEIEKSKAKLKGDRYYLAWQELNQEWDDNRHEFVPNHLLWGYAKPKETLSAAEKEKFIDKAKTSAVRILNEVFEERTTKYYIAKYEQMANDYGVDSKEFKTWFANNHVYNPFKHVFEPLACWTTSEVTDAMPGTWEANYGMKERNVKEEATNTEYKRKAGIAGNYKKGTGYDLNSDAALNPFEKELKDYLRGLMLNLSKTKQAIDRVERGYAPAKAKKEDKSLAKVALEELIHSLGWIEGHNGKERYKQDISYGYDYTPTMPLMTQLKSKETVDISKYEEEHKPIRTSTETDAEFNARMKAFEEDVKKVKENNRRIHSEMLDRDWESVFEDYILQSSHYNAIQDNKYQLYYGQKLLDTYMPYQTSSVTGNLEQIDGEYIKKADSNLRNVYDNWIRRLVFDQWKKRQGMATRAAQILQSITSTNYMTLNLRGGIANVLVGETGIFGEAFAREYFGASHWGAGKALWAEGLVDYMTNAYSEKSNTLSGAIVKGFNVVDFDEYTGQVRKLDAEEVSKRLRDMAFIALSGGEHFMQNGALFSMMLSHRVVRNPRAGEPGQHDYTIMNEAEYLRYAADEALGQVATPEEIEAYRNSITADANVQKDYATYRKDFVSEYVFMNLDSDKQKAYVKALKEIKERKKAEFETNPTVHDQFKLGDDGTLAFKEDSIFASINTVREGQDISDAYRLMGEFRGRVISVNKKIHGFYDKMGAALIEREWWGSLVMQYHKHIYPGIMKRYRRKGYFNEERGTIEKGGLWSLIDFLNMPIRKIAAENRLNAAQTETMEGIQNYFKYVTEYLHYAQIAWEILPDSEKANIRRVCQDAIGMLSAICMAIAIRCAWDDDDDSIIYNLALYEADRLATETGMYGIGAYTEFKTLWSSPVAVQSIISDVYSSIGLVSQMLIEGDDFDPYYRSGRYAGKKKLNVRIERRIPYWRNYLAIRDIADSNHYYRIGDNVLSIIPVKKIADKIKDNK